MKYGIATLFAVAAMFSASLTRAEMTHERHVERMQTELKLSDKQAQEVRKIFDDLRPQLEALRKQRLELREKTRERLKSVLTPEQLQQYDRFHEQRRAQRKHRRHGPPPKGAAPG